MAFDGNPARFKINGTASENGAGDRGFIAGNGDLIELQLEDIPSTALSAKFELFDPLIPSSPLASLDAPLLTFIGSGMSSELLTDPDNQVAEFNMAAFGANPFTDIHAYIIRCTVSTPEGPYVFHRMIVTVGVNTALRKTAPAESQEYAARGWSDDLNKMVDLIEAGIGGAGGTFLGLLDTPNSYALQANNLVQVNPAETGLQFSLLSVDPFTGNVSTGGTIGQGQFPGGLIAGGTAAPDMGRLTLVDQPANVDEKNWRVDSSGGRYRIVMLDDAFASDVDVFRLERTGMVLNSVFIGDGGGPPLTGFVFGSWQVLDRLSVAGFAGSEVLISDASQPVDQKVWRLRADANLSIQAVNDAIALPVDILTFVRGAGTAVTVIEVGTNLDMNAFDILGTGDRFGSNFIADDLAGGAPNFNGITGNAPVFVGQNLNAPLLAGGGTQGEDIPIFGLATNFGGGPNGGLWAHHIADRDPEGNVTADGGSTLVVDSPLASTSKFFVKEGDASNIGWRELSKLTNGYINGFVLNYQSVSLVGVQSGVCRSDDDRYDIVDSTGLLFANIALAGAGGLDTGVEAASTWYSVWVIANSTTGAVSSLLSTSSSAPTMPAGFDKKRRLGWVYNNSASDFRPFNMTGNSRDRKVFYQQTRTNLTVFTAQEPTIWTTQGLSVFVPPTSRRVDLLVEMDAGANHYVEFRVTGSGLANGEGYRFASTGGQFLSHAIRGFPTNNSREIDYRRDDTSGNGVNLYVYGYEDSV